MEEIMTLEQAAKRLHMAPRTVRERISRGELRASKPGRQLLITESALMQFLESTAVKPGAALNGD